MTDMMTDKQKGILLAKSISREINEYYNFKHKQHLYSLSVSELGCYVADKLGLKRFLDVSSSAEVSREILNESLVVYYSEEGNITERRFNIVKQIGKYLEPNASEDFLLAFANEMIMPEESMIHCVSRDYSNYKMALTFGVSVDAIENRLRELFDIKNN